MQRKNIFYIFLCTLSINFYVFGMSNNEVTAQTMIFYVKDYMSKDANDNHWTALSQSSNILSNLTSAHLDDIWNLMIDNKDNRATFDQIDLKFITSQNKFTTTLFLLELIEKKGDFESSEQKNKYFKSYMDLVNSYINQIFYTASLYITQNNDLIKKNKDLEEKCLSLKKERIGFIVVIAVFFSYILKLEFF